MHTVKTAHIEIPEATIQHGLENGIRSDQHNYHLTPLQHNSDQLEN